MDYMRLFTVLVVILALVGVSGCAKPDVDTDDLDGSTILGEAPQDVGATVNQPKQLTEFQVEACNAAHDAGTCDTKLKQLGIVSKKDCCSSLSKCC